jgi:hypothetical protein
MIGFQSIRFSGSQFRSVVERSSKLLENCLSTRNQFSSRGRWSLSMWANFLIGSILERIVLVLVCRVPGFYISIRGKPQEDRLSGGLLPKIWLKARKAEEEGRPNCKLGELGEMWLEGRVS